jgi:hypothetical protein
MAGGGIYSVRPSFWTGHPHSCRKDDPEGWGQGSRPSPSIPSPQGITAPSTRAGRSHTPGPRQSATRARRSEYGPDWRGDHWSRLSLPFRWPTGMRVPPGPVGPTRRGPVLPFLEEPGAAARSGGAGGSAGRAPKSEAPLREHPRRRETGQSPGLGPRSKEPLRSEGRRLPVGKEG